MSDPGDDLLLRLAKAVADGEPVDWPESPPSGGAPDPRVRRLRLLAALASACGMPPEAPRAAAASPDRWGHLEIREKIGEGVFGEVFRAWDTTLEREVAVKFLREGGPPAAAHALQEGRHLARIRHPGVAVVHGAELLDGRVGIWMELVRGRTLEDLLQERGPFAAPEAIRIGIDLCRALAAVHAAGLVHRDVKTRNVVREDTGRIVLMDLGAGMDARNEDRSAADFTGTPVYLAPEILRGEPASPRSDLYSLGVLLYRLVTGDYPIAGASLEALRGAHARGEARPLRAARPELPAAFVRAVEHSLAADPARRFADAGQMEAALLAALEAPRHAARWRARVAALTVVGSLAVWFAVVAPRGPDQGSTPAPARPEIAVADVVNEAREEELDALAGMLATSLDQSPSLSVLTRSRMRDVLARSGRTLEGRIDEALGLEICRLGNAAALLVPSVRRVGDRYRVGLEAVDPRNGRRRFTATAEARDRNELPSVVDALSRRVREELAGGPGATRDSVRPVAQITTASLGAFLHYDRAERHIDRLQMAEARAELERAIGLDPTFGLAHSRLAYVCWWLNDQDCERDQLTRAFALIDRVPERQRYHLRAQGALADRQGLEAARSILLEMERFYPHDKEMLYDIGDYSSHLSEYPAAIQYLEQVVAMDPGFVRALQHLARVYRDMGRHEPFLLWARRYAAADSAWDSDQLLGDALVATGDAAGGLARLARGCERAPEHAHDITLSIAAARLHQGQVAEGMRTWDRMIDTASTAPVRVGLYHGRATAHVHRGAYRDALADLERAAGLARRAGAPAAEAMARVDAATLQRLGRDDRPAALRTMERCLALGRSITYENNYFQYWGFWGGLFKLHLLNGDPAAADALARERFAADKWYGPYVSAYRHAARGECAQAAAAASRVLEWGPAAENIPLLYFLARCQVEHGQLDAAEASLLRLQSLCTHLTLGTPYYAKSLSLLGEVYERKGDARRAARSCTTLLALWRDADPDLPDLLEARRRLRRLDPMLRQTEPAASRRAPGAPGSG